MKCYNAKITKEFCWNKSLIFFPETAEEVVFIQEKLFGMGYEWKETGKNVSHIEQCLSRGLILDDGTIYWRGEGNTRDYFVCKSSQLAGGEKFMAPAEQSSLRDEFNELSKLVREMSKKVDEMYDEVMPKRLNKFGEKRAPKI